MDNNVDIQKLTVATINSNDDSSYDVQIATAKKYPRNIRESVESMIAIATMDKKTAESCGYALPRAGKNVTGASIVLAKIVIQNWGNIRVEAKVSKITNTNIYSEAVVFDLQSNVAIKVEATRKIVQRNGTRFNEDLIALTGLVTNSIAMRNAIFAIVPKSVIDKVYDAAMQEITGDLSDENKLAKRRTKIVQDFKDVYKVSEEEILTLLSVNSVLQIKAEEIKLLIGYAQALKDKEMSVDNMFRRNKDSEVPNPMR